MFSLKPKKRNQKRLLPTHYFPVKLAALSNYTHWHPVSLYKLIEHYVMSTPFWTFLTGIWHNWFPTNITNLFYFLILFIFSSHFSVFLHISLYFSTCQSICPSIGRVFLISICIEAFLLSYLVCWYIFRSFLSILCSFYIQRNTECWRQAERDRTSLMAWITANQYQMLRFKI